MKGIPLLILLALAIPAASAEVGLPRESRPVVEVPRIPREPTLQEFLGMEVPEDLLGMAKVDGGFVQRLPYDGRPATHRTVVLLGYDDRALHVVFLAFDDAPERIRATLGRRETIFGDDIVQIMLDTFLDERRAYSFICNPYGVQFDAVWTEGSEFDMSFDTVWESEGAITERGYVVRMAIPWKSLRFPRAPSQRWGFLLNRDVPRLSEEAFFPHYSNRIEGRLNQTGTLVGLEGISPGRNLQLIPYATARGFRVLDGTLPGGPGFVEDDLDPDVGLDAKIVLKDRFVLDLTANPDFSQVESDRPQITSTERFEVFFPEKRPFFLENATYFATPYPLLFTRRIRDPRGGIRLTGKAGGWAFGALAMDDEAPDNAPPGESARVLVGRVSRDLFEQSSVGVLATDREVAGNRNTVVSADARIKWNANWTSVLQGATSRTSDPTGPASEGEAFLANLERSGRHFGAFFRLQKIDPEFRTEAGFMPRTGFRDAITNLRYIFRPGGDRLLSWAPEITARRVEDPDGLRLDEWAMGTLAFEFPRRTTIELTARTMNERIPPLDYERDEIEFSVESQPLASFGFALGLARGEEIHLAPLPGLLPQQADSLYGEAEIRVRPIPRLRLDGNILYVRLEEPVGPGRFFTQRIARLKGNLQITPLWSIRAIVQHDALDPDPARSALERVDRWNADLLVTWQRDPWTAVYLGWNSNRENLAILDPGTGPVVVRTPSGRIENARQVFLKVSWLFRP